MQITAFRYREKVRHSWQNNNVFLLERQKSFDAAKTFVSLSIRQNKLPLVFLDIDETLLDARSEIDKIPSLYHQADCTHPQKGWTREIKRVQWYQAYKHFPAFEDALRFYKWLMLNQIPVILLTGRPLFLIQNTRENLTRIGIPLSQKLILRNDFIQSGCRFKRNAMKEQLEQHQATHPDKDIIGIGIGDKASDYQQPGVLAAGFKVPNWIY